MSTGDGAPNQTDFSESALTLNHPQQPKAVDTDTAAAPAASAEATAEPTGNRLAWFAPGTPNSPSANPLSQSLPSYGRITAGKAAYQQHQRAKRRELSPLRVPSARIPLTSSPSQKSVARAASSRELIDLEIGVETL